uniref:WW domain-containing protein n=1 Tax=Octactis speculum TaxID=3111310 RepID=A0A7S2DK15_9STRA|mmetsp:Transcript_49240/g.67137  ORF Transcript_49240/g.67137 Transcript_49240/m.67137 type:complete len:948 (+) Transcript_49240:1-2844(+)
MLELLESPTAFHLPKSFGLIKEKWKNTRFTSAKEKWLDLFKIKGSLDEHEFRSMLRRVLCLAPKDISNDEVSSVFCTLDIEGSGQLSVDRLLHLLDNFIYPQSEGSSVPYLEAVDEKDGGVPYLETVDGEASNPYLKTDETVEEDCSVDEDFRDLEELLGSLQNDFFSPSKIAVSPARSASSISSSSTFAPPPTDIAKLPPPNLLEPKKLANLLHGQPEAGDVPDLETVEENLSLSQLQTVQPANEEKGDITHLRVVTTVDTEDSSGPQLKPVKIVEEDGSVRQSKIVDQQDEPQDVVAPEKNATEDGQLDISSSEIEIFDLDLLDSLRTQSLLTSMLSQIHTLNLSNNHLKVLELEPLLALTMLRHLDVSKNLLSRMAPVQDSDSDLTLEIALPMSLETADFSENLLTGISGVTGCERLRRLSVANNKIKNLVGIEDLSNLEELDLRGCRIGAPLHLRILSLNVQLTSLRLKDNVIATNSGYPSFIRDCLPQVEFIDDRPVVPKSRLRKKEQNPPVPPPKPVCPVKQANHAKKLSVQLEHHKTEKRSRALKHSNVPIAFGRPHLPPEIPPSEDNIDMCDKVNKNGRSSVGQAKRMGRLSVTNKHHKTEKNPKARQRAPEMVFGLPTPPPTAPAAVPKTTIKNIKPNPHLDKLHSQKPAHQVAQRKQARYPLDPHVAPHSESLHPESHMLFGKHSNHREYQDPVTPVMRKEHNDVVQRMKHVLSRSAGSDWEGHSGSGLLTSEKNSFSLEEFKRRKAVAAEAAAKTEILQNKSEDNNGTTIENPNDNGHDVDSMVKKVDALNVGASAQQSDESATQNVAEDQEEVLSPAIKKVNRTWVKHDLSKPLYRHPSAMHMSPVTERKSVGQDDLDQTEEEEHEVAIEGGLSKEKVDEVISVTPWVQCWSEEHDRYFYSNNDTGESIWDEPKEGFIIESDDTETSSSEEEDSF